MSHLTLQENQRLLRQQFRAFMTTAKAIMRQLDAEIVTPHAVALINVETIQQIVCEAYAVPAAAMSSQIRTNSYALPRQVAMVLCRELTKHAITDIGTCFNRDHGTVLHASKSITNRISSDPKFSKEFHAIREKCENALKNLTMPLFNQS